MDKLLTFSFASHFCSLFLLLMYFVTPDHASMMAQIAFYGAAVFCAGGLGCLAASVYHEHTQN